MSTSPAEGTSFTEEKRLKVLKFPLPETQKLQFIGLASYFRDHVQNMTEMTQPLRKLISRKSYKSSSKLVWTQRPSKHSSTVSRPSRTAKSSTFWRTRRPRSYKPMPRTMASGDSSSWSLTASPGERMLWHLLRSAALRGLIHPQD